MGPAIVLGSVTVLWASVSSSRPCVWQQVVERRGCRRNLMLIVLYAGHSVDAAANDRNFATKSHGTALLSVLSSGIGSRGAVGESSASVEAQNVVDSEAVASLLAEARLAIMEARKVQEQWRRGMLRKLCLFGIMQQNCKGICMKPRLCRSLLLQTVELAGPSATWSVAPGATLLDCVTAASPALVHYIAPWLSAMCRYLAPEVWLVTLLSSASGLPRACFF